MSYKRFIKTRRLDKVQSVVLLCIVTSPLAAVEPDSKTVSPRIDCCYDRPAVPAESHADPPWIRILLPDDDLFRPILADMKQPRFYAGYRHVKFYGQSLPAGREGNVIDAGVVAMGGEFGLWGLRRSGCCDGFQINVMGGIFSQFNLDTPSVDLINTDFLVGLPLTFRQGRFSSRLRLYHQSSHLGDEFLLNNPDIDRQDLSFETVDILFSYDGSWWRFYGGAGRILHFNPGLEPGLLQWGLELRASQRPWRALKPTQFVPVLGIDFNALEEREWAVTTSLKGGVELLSPVKARRFRVLFVYLRGFIPFGQFFNSEKIENLGVEMQFEY